MSGGDKILVPAKNPIKAALCPFAIQFKATHFLQLPQRRDYLLSGGVKSYYEIKNDGELLNTEKTMIKSGKSGFKALNAFSLWGNKSAKTLFLN